MVMGILVLDDWHLLAQRKELLTCAQDFSLYYFCRFNICKRSGNSYESLEKSNS